ncbi:hypothetical protein FH608_048200 [Nonomuraea phyllanthi]|uniref:Uncharacterized protein n=1 Tax=Nonomuraea phyllanthi TaxID=2219224 RepID=A0A5C4V3E9_9ACTN|nr:hypothetical protein [Nonomuraea phyllanthi]KAB8184755.1 hypothetical protein FH608_048200 [Nonomuraea phyllanthi]QFY09373.1 hypothetical protein GBF35_24430 [Nonomuraea phyllanthi]
MKATLFKRAIVVVVLIAAGLLSTGTTASAAPPDGGAAQEAGEVGVAGALVSVSPSAEYTEDPLGMGRAAWTKRCPAYRFCTTQVGSGGQSIGFQFYKCTTYALTNWGVNGDDSHSLVYNHQNVTVKYLDRRYAEIQSTPPGYFEIIDFKPVWYISLCN